MKSTTIVNNEKYSLHATVSGKVWAFFGVEVCLQFNSLLTKGK